MTTDEATYAELLQQHAELEQQIAEVRQTEMAQAVLHSRLLIQKFGLTKSDIFPDEKPLRIPRKKSGIPKYRDPATGRTWSGRGRQPDWIRGQDRLLFMIQ